MTITITNYMLADRRSAVAYEAMDQGSVILISDDGTGQRLAKKCGNSDSAKLLAGAYGVAYKVSVDPYQVDGTTAPAITGNRVVTIFSGDNIVEVSRKAIIEYSADSLDASLDPSRSGTTPAVGDALGVVGAKFCAAGAVSAITSPVIGKVFRVHGTRVLIELL